MNKRLKKKRYKQVVLTAEKDSLSRSMWKWLKRPRYHTENEIHDLYKIYDDKVRLLYRCKTHRQALRTATRYLYETARYMTTRKIVMRFKGWRKHEQSN